MLRTNDIAGLVPCFLCENGKGVIVVLCFNYVKFCLLSLWKSHLSLSHAGFESHSGLSCYYKSGIKNCKYCTIHDFKMSTIIKGEWTIVTLFFEEALLLNFVFFGINLAIKEINLTCRPWKQIPIYCCFIFHCSHPMLVVEWG